MSIFASPNYTQIPNSVVDELMATLSPAEFKCIMLILRETLGYHRRTAPIPISCFMEKGNLSKQGVINSIGSLEKKDIVLVERFGDWKTANQYTIKIETPQSQPEKEVVNSVGEGGKLSRRGRVNSVDSLNKGKETSKENNNEREPVVVSSFLQNMDMPEPLKQTLSEKYKDDPQRIKDACEAVSQIKPRNLEAVIQTALAEGWKPRASKETFFEKNKAWAQENLMQYDGKKVGFHQCDVLSKHVEFSTNAQSLPRFFNYEDASFQADVLCFIRKYK